VQDRWLAETNWLYLGRDIVLVLGTVYAVLFYFAVAIFAVGLALRIRLYARTPAPLKIPTTPAPVTQVGVVVRMAKEVVFFESLFKANKWTWLFGWIFHFALLLVLLRHLRYFTEPAGLWVRRFAVERIRYISSPSDHLMLLLLIGIAATGLMMKYVAHTDILSLKAFILGLIYFDWQPIPADPVLLVHLGLVLTLMIIFPFSKLLHAPGVFFSPGRNQVDNPREKRHFVPQTKVPGK